jgi:hypothetical protein
MLRLRRWLGSALGKATIRRRAAEALAECPKHAHRQRACLHVLHGDFGAAAKLLASAPGLGWSHSEHPGHLLFHVFRRLLGGGPAPSITGAALPGYGVDVVLQAGIESMPDGNVRAGVLATVRKLPQSAVAALSIQVT